MGHISYTLKGNYRYTGTKKYKEYQHQRTCLKTQRETSKYLETQALRDELLFLGVITLKEFTSVIQRVYDTYPVEKQDDAIQRILKARLLLEKESE